MVFKCLDGCAKCCGFVVFPKELLEKVRHKQVYSCEWDVFDKDRMVNLSLPCPFVGVDLKCVIYDERPDVCRKFGLIEKLPCPFVKPNGNKRGVAKTKQILRAQGKKVDKLLKEMV